MNFNLSFNISQENDCKTVVLCDSTCKVNHYNKYTCCDGYGVDDNINVEDIDHTLFHFQMPDGNEFFNVDMGWVPGTRAKGSFQVTGGTDGVIVVDVDSLIIGQAIFVTDIATTVELLIQSINSIAANTGWQAYLLDGTTDTVIICSVEMGEEFNGKDITLSFSGDLTGTMITDPTAGANGNQSCISFSTEDIYGIDNCPPTNDFADGVYHITYMLFDADDKELHRVTNSVLFTCKLKECIRKLILLPAENSCVCSDGFNKKLVELRLMLEKAEVQMDQCLYDCANDTILRAHKFAQGICLDC